MRTLTVLEADFYQRDVPKIIKALESLAESFEKLTAHIELEKEMEDVDS